MAVAMLSRVEKRGQIGLDHVHKAYGPTQVLRGVSFDLYEGELLTLLGPSGSGKSTTLGVIAGFVEPTKGEVRLGDRPITHVPPKRRGMGIVFQSYALFPHMSVVENVEFGLRMRKVRSKERRRFAEEMLSRVGLEGLGTRKPSELSGGQRQRAALARALIIEPVALLLDEPLGALDRQLRQRMELELKDIQRQTGVSVLHVTHDQEEAMVMSDRIAVMRDGVIEQIGVPAEIYQHPKTKFVAKFLGETNLLDATVTKIDGECACVTYADGSRGMVRVAKGDWAGTGNGRTVCVRPERIAIDAGPPAANSVEGTVTRRDYLGSSVRCSVEVLNQEILVSWPDRANLVPPEVGARVRLGWGVEDGQVLSERGDAQETVEWAGTPAGLSNASTDGDRPSLGS